MIGTWRAVADSARTTIGLEPGEKEVSDAWKKKILLAEHSPIRKLHFSWKFYDIPYYVSVHLTRHWLGIEHFVRTSRTDRTGVDRTKLPQDHLVTHECEANAQALINISRKRLCACADPVTREAWSLFHMELLHTDPTVASVCVPECIYRGFCPEFKSCGYIDSIEGQFQLMAYRSK